MFVRPDYKLNAKVRRPRGRYRLRILAAAGLLAATFGSVKYLDIDAENLHRLISEAEAAPLLTAALTLPGATQPVSASTGPQQAEVALPPPARESDGHAPNRAESTATAAITPTVSTATVPSLLDNIITVTKSDQAQADGNAPAEDLQEFESPADLDTALETSSEPEPAVIAQVPQRHWTQHEVASGDSLARIFDAQGLEASLLHRIINSGKEAKSLARIRPGQKLRFEFDDNDELTALELQRNRVECLRIAIADDEIQTEKISKDVEKRLASAAGLIESSLFLDGQQAGLSDSVIMEMATIFGWDIDFALEIRAGDQFRVLYEEHYLEGEKLRDGPILAAEFTNRGKAYTAVRYKDHNGEIGYFDADGHSKRRAFIRTPIKFARVSSRYNPKRWHPVLKRWRSHKGVDYAAPRGTPIKATGDGRIVHRGTKGGYGRTVIVEHAGKYTTLYAHMSKYSKRAKRGKRVKQGQVIGYVGSSGLATGPHLHYEFRVHGRHRDPLRVKLPKSLSLPKSEIAKFRAVTAPLLTQLAAIPADTMVASAGVTGTH